MRHNKHLMWALLLVVGCGGNPFTVVETPTPTPDGIGDLPGTVNPTTGGAITRREPTSAEAPGGSYGDGFAQGFVYDTTNNTFTIDNLAFDADNIYTLSAPQPAGGALGYSVYESADTFPDSQTGVAIDQFTHRLLTGKSPSGASEFAIVRTGAYRDYGFGGFVLKRTNGVVIPTTGQAEFTGKYAGLRDFAGISGLQYVSGDMNVSIDFKDFNDGEAVKGTVSNRRIYNINGSDITASVLSAMDTKYDPDDKVSDLTALPALLFAVGPNAIDNNGEAGGSLQSYITDYTGDIPAVLTFEQGKYYAILSGAALDELVGIIVVTSPNPAITGVTVRETGGFILYRP